MALQHLNDLSAFAVVARLRSFRQAAAQLHVSPSALSHTVRGLEERLGVRLLNRTTRSVSPTVAGEKLLARLSPALMDIQSALDEVNTFRDSPVGILRLNAPRAAAELVLAPLLTRFLRTHPGMKVDLVTDDSLVDIVAGGFDAGLRFGESLQQDMVALPLGQAQRFVVVGSPGYLQANGVPESPQDLQHHDCIGIRFPSGAHYRWEFVNGAQRVDVAVSGPLAVGDMPLVLAAAEAGLGLAYVYAAFAEPSLASGRLSQVLAAWSLPAQRLFLYYPSRKLMPAGLKAFVSMVKAQGDA